MNKGIDDFLKMGCKEKHSPINEYRKRGGLAGYAVQILKDELAKAEFDEGHCLHLTTKAIKEDNIKEISSSLLDALINLPDDSPLTPVKVLLITIPHSQQLIAEAKDHFLSGNDQALNDYSQTVRDYAAMEATLEICNKNRTQKATTANTKYTKDEKLKWRKMADQIDPQRLNKSKTARDIADHFKLPTEALDTIRREI